MIGIFLGLSALTMVAYVEPADGCQTTVPFGFDKAVMDVSAQDTLQGLLEQLRNNTQQTITFEGHTNRAGTREYNLALGGRRAESVMHYFLSQNISQSRMKVISYGEEKPVSEKMGSALNRRVEIKVEGCTNTD